MTIYNDDDPVNDLVPDIEGTESDPFVTEKVTMKFIRKDEASLGVTDFKVMVKLMATPDANYRAPLDLVAVLDVSGSMNDEETVNNIKSTKLENLKTAMKFVIKKLGPCDRLSIVTFAKSPEKKTGLRRMTANTPAEMENIVTGLTANDATNIIGGLQEGQQVLDSRQYYIGRQPAIMLLTDGDDNVNSENGVLKVPIPTSNVPVYTFGFGKSQNAKLLSDIAVNSRGGTFSTVDDGKPLTEHFSMRLGGLVTTVVQDLELTLTQVPENSEITGVSIGKYPQPKNPDKGSITVKLGSLCSKETRKVLVHLRLASFQKRTRSNILNIGYSHSDGQSNPVTVNILRSGRKSVMPEKDEIARELDRVTIVDLIRTAVSYADKKDYPSAVNYVEKAQNLLKNAAYEDDKILEYELQQLREFLKSKENYEPQGCNFALSFLSSHDRQHFASRGDLKQTGSFATPRMEDYLNQGTAFHNDATKPPPKEADDLKNDRIDNPFAPISVPLNNFHQAALEFLKKHEGILDDIKTAQDLETLLGDVEKAARSIEQLQDAVIQFLVGHLKNNIKSL